MGALAVFFLILSFFPIIMYPLEFILKKHYGDLVFEKYPTLKGNHIELGGSIVFHRR